MVLGNMEYNVLDVMGRVVAQGILSNNSEINLKLLPQGTYFLKVAGTTVKIVKL